MFGLSPWRPSCLLSELLRTISNAWLTNLISSKTHGKRRCWSILSGEAATPECALRGWWWLGFNRQWPMHYFWSPRHGESKGSSDTEQVARSSLCCWMWTLLLGSEYRHRWSVNVTDSINFPDFLLRNPTARLIWDIESNHIWSTVKYFVNTIRTYLIRTIYWCQNHASKLHSTYFCAERKVGAGRCAGLIKVPLSHSLWLSHSHWYHRYMVSPAAVQNLDNFRWAERRPS